MKPKKFGRGGIFKLRDGRERGRRKIGNKGGYMRPFRLIYHGISKSHFLTEDRSNRKSHRHLIDAFFSTFDVDLKEEKVQ